MELTSLEAEGRAVNGGGPAKFKVELAARSFRARVRESAILLGAGLLVGLVLLPVPVIHLVGILVFGGSAVLAVKRFQVRSLVWSAAGTCPSCHADTTLYVGGGLRGERWPFTAQCASCGIGVVLVANSNGGPNEKGRQPAS